MSIAILILSELGPKSAFIGKFENFKNETYSSKNSKSNGTVYWQLSGSAVSMCSINTKYFPFDKQRCVITLGKDLKKKSIEETSFNLSKLIILHQTSSCDLCSKTLLCQAGLEPTQTGNYLTIVKKLQSQIKIRLSKLVRYRT